MSRESIVRITARDFDRARIEILRELTGIAPECDTTEEPSHAPMPDSGPVRALDFISTLSAGVRRPDAPRTTRASHARSGQSRLQM
jgi:hypothetical protein